MCSGPRALKRAIATRLASTAGPPALAQTGPAASENATQLEEIAVTVRRRQKSLQSAPVSVSAISAARLDLLNTDTVGQISELMSVEQGENRYAHR